MSILSVRLDKEIEKKLQHLLKLRKINDKSAYIRQILDKSLQADLIEQYCQKIKDRTITIWKAAQLLDISLRQMLVELKHRGISSYSEEALESDIDFMNMRIQ
jgi:predicted HTH domain antitoxin